MLCCGAVQVASIFEAAKRRRAELYRDDNDGVRTRILGHSVHKGQRVHEGHLVVEFTVVMSGFFMAQIQTSVLMCILTPLKILVSGANLRSQQNILTLCSFCLR